MKMRMLFLLTYVIVGLGSCFAISEEARSKGFIDLHDVDPTILISVRYSGQENFVGDVVDGYKQSVIILTKQAAEALQSVQAEVQKDGYSLVVYDAYRPQKAVDHFMRWSEDVANQAKKASYYPRVNKADVFELGYVARRSGHSRGSTVDVTIVKLGHELYEVQKQDRVLLDGYTITLLNDGTVDMGSSFDLFDTASHYENDLIQTKFKERRTYLKNIMEKHGFKNYAEEWWHFTLKDEPYLADRSESYFNFEVE